MDRSTMDLLQTLQELQSWKVSVLAVNGLQFDLCTPHGKLMVSILSSLAEFERDLHVGRRRAAREEGSFSYRNATIIEHDGQCAGCLIGYEIPDQPRPIADDMPDMFVPLQELENLAAGTWYVNVLAVQPRFRGKGLGTKLLGLADETAQTLGKRGLSVIVSDANTGARRLYERCGYGKGATRPMVKENWDNAGQNWVLVPTGIEWREQNANPGTPQRCRSALGLRLGVQTRPCEPLN